jgi:hypothetical protein
VGGHLAEEHTVRGQIFVERHFLPVEIRAPEVVVDVDGLPRRLPASGELLPLGEFAVLDVLAAFSARAGEFERVRLVDAFAVEGVGTTLAFTL